MAIAVRANPAQITWGLFRPVASIPDANDEEAQIAPEASGLERLHPQRMDNGHFRLPSLTITVGLNRSKTMILRTADKTADLLRHEQGHFDLLILVSRALARDLEAIEAESPAELASRLQDARDTHDASAQAIDEAYDDQTDHSRNKAAQAKWNAAISQALGNPKSSQIFSMSL